jgi:hypothetical protein
MSRLTDYTFDPDAADVTELQQIVSGTPAPPPDWTSAVPTDWSGFTGDQKIQYFNQQGITPDQLAPYATPEEIQYFYNNMGYTVGAPAPTPAPTAAPAAATAVDTVAAPAAVDTASAPAPAFNPVGFDWTQGVQNIGGTIYQPQFESVQLGHGEEGGMYGQGALQGVLRYQEGQTAPGQMYEIIDPATGQVTGTGQFKGVGNAWDLLKTAAVDLGPILQFTPLAPFVQAINAGSAIESGNYAQGIGSLAGLGGYTDIANAARLVGAAQSGDPLAALTAGMNLTGTKDIGGFTTKDITAANAVVQGLQTGNVAQALNGAAQLTDSPNIALAGAAVNFYNAAQSGNPGAMLKAGEALNGAINSAQNQAAITTAYSDPSRSLDTVLGGDIRGATMQTTAGVDLGDLGLTEPTITAGELTNIVSGKTDTTAAPAAQTTTTTTATAPTTVDTSGLPAFNKATITTLPQSRAAEIIAEMYPGQSLDWVNQGVLNAAASHIRADDETGLRARLAAGQALGTGDAISGDVAVDYRAPAGSRVAQPGENAGMLGYTETGTPVNLIQQLGTTARKMTPEEAFAYDMANAGDSIDPETGQPYELDTSENARAVADVIRGIPSAVGAGAGEQIKLLGVAGGWLTGNKENALTQIGSNVESWANSITPDSVKQGQDQISKDISKADGLPAKAWAAVKGAATNPLATLHWVLQEGVQEVVPLGSAIAVGRTVSNATKLKFGEDLAQRYGLTAAIGTDATMNAGESATASYEEVYNTLRDKGVADDKAGSAAAAAAAGSGLVTLFTAAIGDAALINNLMNNVKGATIKATLKEGPTEFAEGYLQDKAEQNATNVALGKGFVSDPNQSLSSGVLEKLIGTSTTATISKGADIFTPTVVEPATMATASTTTAPTAAASATQGKIEPTFDPNTVVATDPDSGDAVTLGDLTGSSISSAGTTTKIDPTLEALEGIDLESQQIVSDYVNEVLGGNAPAAGSTENVVVGTDSDTGAEVTLGDLGLTTPAAAATATVTTAPGGVDLAPDAVLVTDAEGNTLTAADVGVGPAAKPETALEGTTQPEAKQGTQPDTQPDTQAELAAAPDTTTTPATALDTAPATQAEPTSTKEPDTQSPTGTAPDTKAEPKAPSDKQPATTPETQAEPKAPTDTQPTTAPDTKAEPDTKSEPKAPSDTQPATQPEAEPTTVVKPETKPTTDIATDTQPKVDTKPDTKVDPTVDTQPEVKTDLAAETKVPTTVTPKVTPEQPPIPPGEDILPPVTEDELRDIVAGPPAPTPAPPAPTPAPPAPTVKPPVVKPPSPAPSPAAQLAQVPGMTPELAKFIQELMQTEEADLLQMTTALKAEREEKREGLRGKLKSRKA